MERLFKHFIKNNVTQQDHFKGDSNEWKTAHLYAEINFNLNLELIQNKLMDMLYIKYIAYQHMASNTCWRHEEICMFLSLDEETSIFY